MNRESHLTKTQLRRSRSRSIGNRSSYVEREVKITLADEMLEDFAYF